MQKGFKRFVVFFVAVMLVFAAGCGQREQVPTGNFAELVDQMGRDVIIPKAPERIISFSPSNTEIAFAIGLGNNVVGVTDFCNYPAEVLDKEKIGGFANTNMELVISLQPDLVLAGNMHEEQVRKLDELNIPVLVLVPESIEGVFEAMRLVAKASGKTEEADAVIGGINNRLKALATKLASVDRISVYYEVYSDPLMTAGGNSLINEVLSVAGADNIFADVKEAYPTISQEVVIERNPQFIVFPNYHGFEGFDMDMLADRTLWAEIEAVKEGNVYQINADTISRPGPRLIDAAESLAAIFYPELFK